MRVACLCTDPGVPWRGTKGASVHFAELVGALAGQGAEVLAIAPGFVGEPLPLPAGVRFERLPGPGKRAATAERLAAEPARTAWLARTLERFGAEALYERFALHTAAGAGAAQMVGVPHLVELNAPLPAESARYRGLDHAAAALRFERTVLGAADLVLAVSRPLARYAAERGARRTKVMPNAVALERFRAPERDGARDPVAVLLATLRPWHGVETVAVAWRRLGSAAPRLLVVGDGPGRELLERVGAEVTGALPHERVPELLAEADIGLVPYAAAAPDYFSPLKLFECLAAGLAVVATGLPGVLEVVRPGTALVVPPGDPARLADAVGRLAADPRLRARLGAAGRELVADSHTWDQRAYEILGAASQLVSLEAVRQ